MRRVALAVLGLVVLLAWPEWVTVGSAQRPTVVPPELTRRAQTQGVVRVIVELDVATQPEGAMVAPARALQRQTIAAVQNQLLAALPPTGHRVARQFTTIPFLALEVAPAAIAALEQIPVVRGVTEDRLEAVSLAESVPLVQSTQAWSAGYDGAGWAVAILDTGVDKSHPFLSGKVIEEACYSGNGSCPNGSTSQIGSGAGVPCAYAPSDCHHGTHVAGIAAGQGPTFSGVAKGASVISVQVFSQFTGVDCADSDEDPCALTYVSDQVAGLQHIYTLRTTRQIAAVNMSVGGAKYTSQGSCDAAEASRKAAIDNLLSVGIATVAASGNEGYSDGIDAPACISSVISVGSTTKSDLISSFTNSASFLSLLAPGSSINSSVPGGGFAPLDGTSMAAPHVTGAWAIGKQKTPAATVSTLLAAFRTSNTWITDPLNGVSVPRLEIATALGLPLDDSLEPDNTSAQASLLSSGTPQSHTFHVNGDVDWARFSVVSGQQFTVHTSNLGSGVDTVMHLYGPDAVTHLAEDDDGGDGVASRLVYTAATTGTYYVKLVQFNGAGVGAYALTLTGPNLVTNGNFSGGLTGWLTDGAPEESNIESTLVNGVFQFRRVPQAPGTPVSQALIFQNTGTAVAAGTAMTATFQLGNTSGARKYMKVLLVGDGGFNDLAACTFWLEPNAPLRTYQMKGFSTQAWTDAAVYFYASSPNTDGGYYQVDNVSFAVTPGGSLTQTDCVDPLAPAAPGGAAGPNLVTNGNFAAGLLPWTTVGSTITLRDPIVGGVLEMYRPTGAFPRGVVLNATGQAMADDQILTATFQLGNSSGVRQRALVIVHDLDFSDLVACSMWLAPGQGLTNFTMTLYASKAWTNATVAVYPRTVGNVPWVRLDNVTLARTPATAIVGTTCAQGGAAAAAPAAVESGASSGGTLGLVASASSTLPTAGDPSGVVANGARRSAGVAAWTAAGDVVLSPGTMWTDNARGLDAVATVTEHATVQWVAPLDLTTASSAVLRFASRLDASASGAEVQVSPDGVTWTTVHEVLPSDTWEAVEIDLRAFVGQVVYLQLMFDAVASRDAADPDVWHVDDVQVEVVGP